MTNSDPIHPGEHLAEFLEELQISQYRLAKVIGTSPRRSMKSSTVAVPSRRIRRCV